MDKDYRDKNLLQETLEELDGLDKEILWAIIHCEYDVELPKETIVLAPSHSQEDLENFYRLQETLEELDGLDKEILWARIHCEWLSREEYDGSEWWEYNKCPKWEEED